MRKLWLSALILGVALAATGGSSLHSAGREAKLVRYPHYHQGRVAFTYIGDIWTADETGQNIHRLTAHKARDVYPRFSPDGKWVAFSSDRNGNLDVYIIPVEGGAPKQLTFHSADDSVQAWSPDSRQVLFASNRNEDFAGKLYVVSIDGGMPKNAGADMGAYATFSPDGRRLAINRRSQAYWRKYYRGAAASDVTVVDVAAAKFTDLTDFDGVDTWPMWSQDRHVYFVSDREGNGLTNIWRVPETGGKAERVTSFSNGDVRWPAMSADGKTIVFEHDFGVWKLDLAGRKSVPIALEIAAETQENLSEVRDFPSEVDEYDLAPSDRRIALSIHGEIFTAPVEQGDLVQITETPSRDKQPLYSRDGKWVAFISDRTGREEIFITPSDGSSQPQQVTSSDTLKLTMTWAPDSKALAYTASDNRLRRYDLASKQTTELAASRYGAIGLPAWSPNGAWIAFAKPVQTRTGEIHLVPASGRVGDEKAVTFDSAADTNPRFSADGGRLFFVRSEGAPFGAGGQPQAQLFAVSLEREERDPNEAEDIDSAERGTRSAEQNEERGTRIADQRGTENAERATKNAGVTIDWPGLKRRTRQVTRMPFAVTSYAVAPEGRTLAFVTTEPAGARMQPVIYTIQDDGRRLTRVTAAAGGGGESDDEAPSAGPGGQGISDLHFTRNGRTLFFKERDGMFSIGLQGGGAQAGTGPPAGAREAARRRINFTAKVRVDRPAEWAEMFDDAWRTMKYRFYDAAMHGKDWDAMRAKYQPLVAHVGDRQELLNILNEMIGELNASHTGTAPPPQARASGAVSTAHLGIDLQPDEKAGRYEVTHVYEGGPADKDWVKVNAGDYLIAIAGRPVKVGDNYWPLLNHRLNRKVEATFNSTPSDQGAWKTRIEPVAMGAFNQLRYERWVRERRAMTGKLSGGRIGYLHIQAMNQPSLRKFEKEVRENRDKEALVIDQRWNGGGGIEQELLAILQQRPYQLTHPRGGEPDYRPYTGFFGPKVVLQNWRSASNAEMFPAGFRALGLGKVIGTPTAGAVIGTGSYTLIDGSTVRTPANAVYLADAKRTNMENYGVPPDIQVENTPEDNLAGRDRQLEVAVQELLKELGKKTSTSAASR